MGQVQPLLTEDEYLAGERSSPVRREYLRGHVYAMAGGLPEHNLIKDNFRTALANRLRGKPCVVVTSDQRIHVPATGLYAYPDVAVVCGNFERHPKDEMTLLNPILLAEVLSESSEAYDRGVKAAHYRSIATLKEHVLVSAAEKKVEHYRRSGAREWILTEYSEADRFPLPALGIEVPVAELYENLELLASPRSSP